MGRPELANSPIYVPVDSQETILAHQWGSLMSIVDCSVNPVPVSDLNQVVLKKLRAESRGLTIFDLKKRSEYSSVTATSCECSDEQETRAVSTPLADAADGLSLIASAIPRVDPQVLTLKHSAFLAQLLIDEVDPGESNHGGSHDHTAFSMQATDGPTGHYLPLNPRQTAFPYLGTT